MKTSPLKVCLILASSLACPSSYAATFTVTTTDDMGPGSLRQAILDANAAANQDTIAFDIAPHDGTVKTILIASSLPTITSPVVLDGYTQPGATSNTLATADNANLLIEITSTNNRPGIVITAGGSTVRGLIINRLSNATIDMQSRGGNVVEGNFIGTDATGLLAPGNGLGVRATASSGTNRIGGPTPGARNIISGSGNFGITLSSAGNVIQGNFIGTDATGTNALPNSQGGHLAWWR